MSAHVYVLTVRKWKTRNGIFIKKHFVFVKIQHLLVFKSSFGKPPVKRITRNGTKINIETFEKAST